jgi:hypothetical protein
MTTPGDLDETLEFYDFGVTVNVVPPPSSELAQH